MGTDNMYVRIDKKILAAVLLTAAMLFSPVTAVLSPAADMDYTNEENANDNAISKINSDTGYQIILEDDADLLTSEEEASLAETMMDITAYGNAAFKTIDINYSSASGYASSYYHEQFGTESGTLFLIDMDNRMLYIFSDGNVYKIVTKGRAETITDNVYRYASNGDYFTCSNEAFTQIYTILNGNEIAQPMKYISNALLAVLLALLINFIIINRASGLRRTGSDPMIHAAKANFQFNEPEVTFINETKVFSPVETSGGGGGGGHGGGGFGGGGGGGHSGGGGGHSF